MKVIKFKKFLTRNKVALNTLPKPIVEKVAVFEELHKILEKVDDSDYEELVEQLEILDLEILQDMEEFLEDRLENNDPLEIRAKTTTIPKVLPKKPGKGLTKDESILQELEGMGKTKNIGRSTLRDLGFKAPLNRNLVIGNYALKRSSVFLYRYDIIPIKDS